MSNIDIDLTPSRIKNQDDQIKKLKEQNRLLDNEVWHFKMLWVNHLKAVVEAPLLTRFKWLFTGVKV